MINLSISNQSLTYDEVIALVKAFDYLVNNPQRGLSVSAMSAYNKIKAEIAEYEKSTLVVEEL